MITRVRRAGSTAGTKRPSARIVRRASKEFEMKSVMLKFVRNTEGQDLIEYALLASVIALGVTAAMLYVKDKLNSEFSSIGNSITTGS
jgi:Flp pilus assembly pilin Flp